MSCNANKTSPLVLFSKEFLRNPIKMGSIIPSSKYLADYVAEQAIAQGDGYIVELGAGTGVVTKAFMRTAIDPERLIIVERSEKLYRYLTEQFPNLRVIHGDAAELTTLVGAARGQVSTVVSGLPFRAFPKDVTQAILQQVMDVLVEHGRVIQYTYSWSKGNAFFPAELARVHSKRIFRNVPPARVDVFERESD